MKKYVGLGFLLTLIIGVSLSIITFIIVHNLEEAKTKNFFKFNAKNHLSTLETTIVSHQEIINSTAALFSSSENITREEFKNYVKMIIKNHPEINGLSWNPLIKDSELKLYSQNAKKDGLSDFKITGFNSNGKRVISTKKDAYIPVYYIEPYKKNKLALGLDISSNKERMQAINKAIDTGNAVATQRIKLVQEDGNNYGYLLMKAIYKRASTIDTVIKRRENFTGLIVGVFSFHNFISTRMKKVETSGIDIWVSDLSAPLEEQFLDFYQSKTRDASLEATAKNLEIAKRGLHLQSSINVLGREWSFTFTPAPKFINDHYSWHSVALSLTILIIISLILLYIYTKAKDNFKIKNTLEHQVNERTKELQKYKNELESIVQQEVEKNKKQTTYIVQQSRLAQMGEMVSMIAHQWRQPLSAISSTSINIKMKLALGLLSDENRKSEDELKKYFEEELDAIEMYTQNLSTTIDDFRNFYKPNKIQVSITLEEIVVRSLKIISSSFANANIKIIEEYSSYMKIKLYDNEMMQVILNILKNAQDNFKEKQIKDPYIKITVTNRTISICDNGGGIKEDIIEEIFNPYFSTKDEKNGTGLGLYMSKTIIEDHHNGKISTKNIDDGVCFTIELDIVHLK